MSEDKNLQQSAPVSGDAENSNAYYEAMKKIEEEKKQKKKKKRKGCLTAFLVIIGLYMLLGAFSGMLNQKVYRDNVTEALEEKVYTYDVLEEYNNNTNDSDKKKAKNYFKWGKLALENEYTETSVSFVKSSISLDEDYKEKATDYYSEYLKENKENRENRAFGQELIKTLEEAEFVIADEIKDLFRYQSIRAVFVSDNTTPGSSILAGDFEVYGVYEDGTEVKLNDDEFEFVDAEKYGNNTTQTIKIKDISNGYETSVKVNCPKEKYFEDYSRSAFANEFYKRMKAKGITGYKMEVDKNDEGIITQVSFYRVIGGYKAYCYLLKFYSTSTQKYKDVYIETNGTKYRYNEMQTLKEILIGMTFGSEDSGRVINNLLGTDGSRTEAGVHYSAFSDDSLGTIQYTLCASVKPDYVTAAK